MSTTGGRGEAGGEAGGICWVLEEAGRRWQVQGGRAMGRRAEAPCARAVQEGWACGRQRAS